MNIDYEKVFSIPRKRNEIGTLFGTTDRIARDKILKLQDNHKIINLQDGNGYFIGNDKQGIKYSFQELHRGISSVEKSCKIINQCEFENIDDMSDFIEKATYGINMLYMAIEHTKKELYELKNIRAVTVRHHLRKVSNGNLDGQQRIEVS